MDYPLSGKVVWHTSSDYRLNDNVDYQTQNSSVVPLIVTLVFAVIIFAFWKKLGVRE